MAEKAEIVLSAKDTTSGAFNSATRNLSGLGDAVGGIAGRLAGIGAAIAVAAEAFDRFNPKPIIDQADQLNKLTQRTGIAVDVLSGYQYAAKLADVSNEELATSFKKLNQNIAAAARGETEQAAAFKAIGVSVVDAGGKVRSTNKIYEDIAEAFSGYEDGANKVALANALAGKSFEKQIPLLNGGKKGLQEAAAELDKYGGRLTGEFAAKAEAFNDNLTRLGTASEALKVLLANGLIDTLLRLSDRLVQASKDGGLLHAALVGLAGISPTVVGVVNLFLPDRDEAAELQSRAENIGKTIDKLREKIAADPGNLPLIARLKDMSKEFDTVQAELSKVNAAKVGVGINSGDFTRGDHDFTPIPAKRPAPPLPVAGAADNAAALLRKQLEGRLKVIEDNLARERDLFQFSDQKLSELYSHGDLSISAYYDAKEKAQLDFIANQVAGFDKLIAEQRAYEAKASKPQDKQDARNKIAELEASRSKALLDSGQTSEKDATAAIRATEQFQRSLTDLDAQLAELSGNKFGAELLRNAQRIDDARKLLNSKEGGDPGRLAQLDAALARQASFNDLQRASSLIADRAQTKEEAALIEADRLGTSRNDTEKKINAIRQQALDDLDALIAKNDQLAKTETDPEILAAYEKIRLARERAFANKDVTVLRFNALVEQGAGNIADAFEQAALSGDKLSDVVKNLEKQLVQLAFKATITDPLKDFLSSSVKGAAGTSGSSGGNGGLIGSLGNLFGGKDQGINAAGAGYSAAKDGAIPVANDSSVLAGLVKFLGSFFHGGGVVGAAGGTQRYMNPAMFTGAERYHMGGRVGLSHDEVPAILKRGEEVIRADDPRHRDNGGMGSWGSGMSVVNHFTISQPASKETQSQVAAAALAGAQRALARNR